MNTHPSPRGAARPAAPPVRSRPSPTRPPQARSDVALFVGFLRFVVSGGHSYGQGWGGGN